MCTRVSKTYPRRGRGEVWILPSRVEDGGQVLPIRVHEVTSCTRVGKDGFVAPKRRRIVTGAATGGGWAVRGPGRYWVIGAARRVGRESKFFPAGRREPRGGPTKRFGLSGAYDAHVRRTGACDASWRASVAAPRYNVVPRAVRRVYGA